MSHTGGVQTQSCERYHLETNIIEGFGLHVQSIVVFVEFEFNKNNSYALYPVSKSGNI